MFSIFSFIAIFYVYFFMDETKGLSDKQKKALYIPGAKFGRELKPYEEPFIVPRSPAINDRNIQKRTSDDTEDS